MTYERYIRPEKLVMLEQRWMTQLPLKGTKREIDYKPAVKLFVPMGSGVWLLSEKEPDTDLAYGLADLGMGQPELGYIGLNELFAARSPGGFMLVAEDLCFEPDKTLSQYASEARREGRIIA